MKVDEEATAREPSRPKRIRVLAAGAIALLLVLFAAEFWSRGRVPERIRKVYTADSHEMEVLDGTPVWTSNPENSVVRWNSDCLEERPDAARVMLLGSSILYGIRLEQADSLGPRLTRRLTDEPCVFNLSEPGFTFQVQRARAEAEIPTIRPDVLVLEVWSNSPKQFHVLGDAAYNFDRLEVDERGLPNPYDLDPAFNHGLLDWSGLYRYMVFGDTPEGMVVGDDWEVFAAEEISSFVDWTEELGIELILVFCPSLGTDFATTAERSRRSYGPVERLAESRGIRSVFLAREFVGLDPEELGMDTCCHFNSRGTMEVADRLAPVVEAALARRGTQTHE